MAKNNEVGTRHLFVVSFFEKIIWLKRKMQLDVMEVLDSSQAEGYSCRAIKQVQIKATKLSTCYALLHA
jgi:hypothetical protein